MNKKKLIWQVPFLALLIIGTVVILKKQPPFRTNEGMVFGTVYKITYQHNDDLQNDIREALMEVDNSLSPYNPNSIITRINHNEDTVLNEHFTHVFNLAQQISAETDGAFDITVAPLVNAWGFGFKHSIEIAPEVIDSLRSFIGYQKIQLENGKVVKEDERTMLDCSAIAISATDTCSPVVRSISISLLEASGLILFARESKLSVVSPIAESTTTTSWPFL
jgi:thiamine biosynthesis lipoprotein